MHKHVVVSIVYLYQAPDYEEVFIQASPIEVYF